ncbi:hemin uptake protein HemP [Inquilinus sp. CAU 1745]|uniref:hemin uptake protein HemP n=1 Tax=Inquilinus sp. CAU 1745 TaxID=3140369 RepID=UPI00325B103A
MAEKADTVSSTGLPAASPDATGGGPRTIDSRTLLKGRREVVIAHGVERYRLTLTRQGKLILTK